MSISLRHARRELRLYRLRDGNPGARPLLLLHGAGESSTRWGAELDVWDGAAFGLDFAGHGHSDWIRSGVYYSEMLCGDADAALAQIEQPVCVAGVGLGAYVALLLAGARPKQVEAALLAAGAGLEGGGIGPDFSVRPLPTPGDPARDAFDPRIGQLDFETRPSAYAADFARRARRIVLLEDDQDRPAWWHACSEAGSQVVRGSLAEGLVRLAG